MGGKKNSGDTFGTVLAIIVVVFVMLLAVAPVFLLLGWLYNLFRYKTVSKSLNGNYSDFWLTIDQKENFRETYSALSAALGQLNAAKQQGLDAGVSVNKDGRFTARSQLGKELRQRVETLEPKVNELTRRYYRLRDMPKEQWDSVVVATKRVKSFEWAMMLWVNGFVISMYFMLKEIGLNINALGFSQEHLDVIIKSIQSSENGWLYLIGGLASAAFLGGVGYLVGGWRGAKNGSNLSPEPPEVTPENCFQY